MRQALKDAGTKIERVKAVGGATRSEIWMKIIATALNLPIDLPADGEVGGAFGAARLGMIAATGADYREICLPPKIAKTIKPEASARQAYEDHYARYTRVYPAIKDIMPT